MALLLRLADRIEIRAPHFTPPFFYIAPPPGPTQVGLNINLFPPPTPPDTTHLPRAPYFSPPRAPLPPGLTWVSWMPLWLLPSQPPGENLFDLPPKGPPEPATRTWTWSYNLNLIGQDKLPVGEQVTELWPRPNYRLEQTWTWRQVGMLGRDQLPVGDQVTDLPPRAALRLPLYSWEWRQVGMLGLDTLPAGEQITDLAPKAAPRAPYYGTEWRQVDKLGLDQLPVGEIVTELPRAPYRLEQTWTANLLETTLTPIAGPLGVVANQYDWPLPGRPSRLEQTTAWNQTPMLGQDQFPVGEQSTDLPPRAAARFQDDYGWTWRQVLELGQDKLPAGAQRYELPVAHLIARPIDQTWTWRQVGMLGKDQLPVGEQSTDLTPKAAARSPLYSWEWRQVDKLGLDTLPFNQYDWPNPRATFRIEQTWALNLNLTTLGPVAGPLGVLTSYQYDTLPAQPFRIEQTWALNLQTTTLQPISVPQQIIVQSTELPRTAQRIDETWTWRQVGMLGQDQLPVGAQVTDLAPRAAARSSYYGTEWRQVDKLGLDRLPVGTQIYDTTAQRYVPYRPEQTTTWRQVTMLGQDRLPIGAQSFDLPPKPPARSSYYGTEWRQVDKLGLDTLPAGAQSIDLTPKAALRQVDLSNLAQSTNLALLTAPPDIHLTITKTAGADPAAAGREGSA